MSFLLSSVQLFCNVFTCHGPSTADGSSPGLSGELAGWNKTSRMSSLNCPHCLPSPGSTTVQHSGVPGAFPHSWNILPSLPCQSCLGHFLHIVAQQETSLCLNTRSFGRHLVLHISSLNRVLSFHFVTRCHASLLCDLFCIYMT